MFEKKRIKEDSDKVLKVRGSRKTYIFFYVLALILVVFSAYIFFSGRPLNTFALVLIVVFVLLTIKVTEIHRFLNLYEVNPESFIHTRGIFNKTFENIDFLAVSHLEIVQSLWQRILNFGDVNVRVFGRENTNFVKNISDPFKFVRFFEDRVNEKRSSPTVEDKNRMGRLHISKRHKRFTEK